MFPVKQLICNFEAVEGNTSEHPAASRQFLAEDIALMLVGLLNSTEPQGPRMYPTTHVARLWSLSIEHLAAADPKLIADNKVTEKLAQAVLD